MPTAWGKTLTGTTKRNFFLIFALVKIKEKVRFKRDFSLFCSLE
jgi:hypothetical protein